MQQILFNSNKKINLSELNPSIIINYCSISTIIRSSFNKKNSVRHLSSVLKKVDDSYFV